MNKGDQQILSLLEAMCSEANEDLAHLNWLLAAEVIANLPASARERILTTELGRRIQVELWQMWLTKTDPFPDGPIEKLLVCLATNSLVEKVIASGNNDSIVPLLGKIGSQRAVEHLIHIARSPNTELLQRREAVTALGVARSPEAVSALRDWLDDETLRDEATLALGQANSPDSAYILIALLKSDPLSKAEEALTRLSNPAIAEVILKDISIDSPPPLLTALSKVSYEQSAVQLQALIFEANSKIGDKTQWSDDQTGQYESIIQHGIEALSFIPSPVAVAVLVDIAQQTTFSNDNRHRAIQALGNIHLALAHRALVNLVLEVSLSSELRKAAAEILPQPLPSWAEQILIDAFNQQSPDELLAEQLAVALRSCPSMASLTALHQLLHYPVQTIQDNAALSLAGLKDRTAEPVLLEILVSRQAQGNISVLPIIVALRHIGSSEAVPVLLDLLKDDRYIGIWGEIAGVLAHIGGPGVATALIECAETVKGVKNFQSNPWRPVMESLACLGDSTSIVYLLNELENNANLIGHWSSIFRQINRREAMPLLIERGLTSNNPTVRQNCLLGLGKIGDPAAIPALVASLRDNHEDVSIAAENALAYQITSLDDPSIAHTLLTAIGDSTIERNWSLFECLQRAQGEAVAVVCQQLQGWLGSPPSHLQNSIYRIIQILKQLSCEEAVNIIGHVLLTSPDAPSRREAVHALGRFGTSESALYLLQAFQTENDPEIQHDIRQSLTQIQFLCELIDHLPITRQILATLAFRSKIRIFADGRVTMPGGWPQPCRDALQERFNYHPSPSHESDNRYAD